MKSLYETQIELTDEKLHLNGKEGASLKRMLGKFGEELYVTKAKRMKKLIKDHPHNRYYSMRPSKIECMWNELVEIQPLKNSKFAFGEVQTAEQYLASHPENTEPVPF